MKSLEQWGIGLAALLVLVTFGQPAARAASTPPGMDSPGVPPRTWSGQLSLPRPEAPPAYDAEVEFQRCVVCKLAASSTGRLPSGSYRIEGSATASGAALRLVSDDPVIRDALWQATLARGHLLSALRAGADLDLCRSCRMQRAALTDLEITAHRIPEGVALVYASRSPVIVHQIHTVVRAGIDAPLQF